MVQRRWVRTCVSLGAIVALSIFICACTGWPSWNSDGTKIAFPFVQTDPVVGDRSGIAVYDLRSNRLTEVMSSPKNNNNDYPVLIPQWVKGDDLTVIAYTSNFVTLDILPIEKQGVLKHILFDGNAPDRDVVHQPSPEIDGKLYISNIGHDLNEFAIVDLKIGAYEFRRFGGDDGPGATLDSAGGGIVYSRRVIIEAFPDGSSKAKWEFGSVPLPEFGPKPAFELNSEDLGISSLEMDSVVEAVAWDRRTAQVALSLSKASKKPLVVRVDNGWRMLEPNWDLKEYKILDVIWSADGRSLYVGVVSPAEGGVEYSIAGIPLNGGRSTLTKVCNIPLSKFEDASDLAYYLRLSLSPDGKTVATTTATLGLPDADRNGLFLFDVGGPNGAIKFVPLTSMAAHR